MQTIVVVVVGGLFALIPLAQAESPPKVDHILLEVADLKNPLAFYHDLLGLEVKSQTEDFAMLQSRNVGVFRSGTGWDWDEKRPANARPGWGMYPHFAMADVASKVERPENPDT